MAKIGNREFVTFITSRELQMRVKSMAEELTADYRGKDPLFLIILNGAFMFATDLLKEIKIPARLSFIKVASYRGTESTGEICELIGLSENLKDKDVILVDDIIDTGLTMKKVMDKVREEKPASVKIVSLLLKPDAFGNQFDVDYVGFTIPNDFVVGYGLDYDGYGRNLKDLYKLK